VAWATGWSRTWPRGQSVGMRTVLLRTGHFRPQDLAGRPADVLWIRWRTCRERCHEPNPSILSPNSYWVLPAVSWPAATRRLSLRSTPGQTARGCWTRGGLFLDLTEEGELPPTSRRRWRKGRAPHRHRRLPSATLMYRRRGNGHHPRHDRRGPSRPAMSSTCTAGAARAGPDGRPLLPGAARMAGEAALAEIAGCARGAMSRRHRRRRSSGHGPELARGVSNTNRP